jgi:hypothetical protein
MMRREGWMMGRDKTMYHIFGPERLMGFGSEKDVRIYRYNFYIKKTPTLIDIIQTYVFGSTFFFPFNFNLAGCTKSMA